jgi:hypothetical protein
MHRTEYVLLTIVLLAWCAIACGVAIQGRIDVGSDAGRPRTDSPCPGTVE